MVGHGGSNSGVGRAARQDRRLLAAMTGRTVEKGGGRVEARSSGDWKLVRDGGRGVRGSQVSKAPKGREERV